MTMTAADILAPITPEAFLAEYQGRRWLHVPGHAGKFAAMMDWEKLNQLLGMEIWTQALLKLFLDGKPVPAEQYCQRTVTRGHQQTIAPNMAAVRQWLQRGAGLVLNEVESLNPGLRAAMRALEGFLAAKSTMNLYCTFKEKQAFASHFDNHDVWAFHFEGEKVWRIYENRADYPIEHPAFQGIPQAQFDQMKGRIAAEVTMRPGDLLYLPRGTFHDALALTDGCIHIACTVSAPIGLQWLTQLWQLAMRDPVFRMDLPPGEAALRAHVDRLRQSFTRLLNSDEAMKQALTLRQPPAAPAPEISLPGDGPKRS